MTTDLEARLRRYGTTLDNATSTDPTPAHGRDTATNVAEFKVSSTSVRPRRRTGSLIAAAGLVAAASVAFVATITERDTPTPTPTPAPASQPGSVGTTVAAVGNTMPVAETACQSTPPATAPPTVVPLDETAVDPLGIPATVAPFASDPATLATAPPTTANTTATDVTSNAGAPATPPPLDASSLLNRSVVHVESPPPLIPQSDLDFLRIDACPRYVLTAQGMRLFIVTPDDTRTGIIVTTGDGYLASWFDNNTIGGGDAYLYRPEAPAVLAGIVSDDVTSIIVDGSEIPIVDHAWLAVPGSAVSTFTVVRADGTTQITDLSAEPE